MASWMRPSRQYPSTMGVYVCTIGLQPSSTIGLQSHSRFSHRRCRCCCCEGGEATTDPSTGGVGRGLDSSEPSEEDDEDGMGRARRATAEAEKAMRPRRRSRAVEMEAARTMVASGEREWFQMGKVAGENKGKGYRAARNERSGAPTRGPTATHPPAGSGLARASAASGTDTPSSPRHRATGLRTPSSRIGAMAAAACSFRSVARAPPLLRSPDARRVRCCSAAPSGAASTSKLVWEVKERLEREQPGLPTGRNGRDDEDMILWFLKDRKFSVDEAVAKLTKAIKWRQDFGVSELSEESVKGLYQTGKAYVHDYLDIYGRPVLVVVAAKHLPYKQDPVENEKLSAYLIEKALSRLPLGVENILGIFDLRGFGVENGDLQFLRFLIDVFYYYYPKRLGQVLFVDAPFVFQPLWQMVKPLLKSYASLVRFCDVETMRKEYFTEETVPPDFCS